MVQCFNNRATTRPRLSYPGSNRGKRSKRPMPRPLCGAVTETGEVCGYLAFAPNSDNSDTHFLSQLIRFTREVRRKSLFVRAKAERCERCAWIELDQDTVEVNPGPPDESTSYTKRIVDY